jgi:Regulator of chromosome condensation (RCC1) repeat
MSAAAMRCATLATIAVLTALSACNSAPGQATQGRGVGGAGGGSAGATAVGGGSAGATAVGGGESGAGGATSAGGAAGISAGPIDDAGLDAMQNVDGVAADVPDVTMRTVDAGAPVPILALSVAVGRFHGCAVLEDHTVKCWGDNGAGELGYGDTRIRGNSGVEMGDALPRVDLGTGRTATAIAASREHTCALLDDGSVKCWGEGRSLGLPDTTTRGSRPGQMGDALPALDLGAGRRATQIAAGYDTSCALLDDDTVKCWGDQDPLDSTATHMLPRSMSLATTTKVRELIAGGHGVFVLLDDGELLGELPRQPATTWLSRVAAFAGARESRCALFMGGGSLCTSAAGGQLPNTVADLLTVGVGEIDNVCGLKVDGSVRCWGFAASQATYWHDAVTTVLEVQQAGLPVLIPGKVSAIASGGELHMCALAADGRVWCWGSGGAALGASSGGVLASGETNNGWSAVNLGTRH